MIKISIITPVLNGEKFIEKTIKSVINQSYENLEYIIVDGFSQEIIPLCPLSITSSIIA